MLGSRPYYLFFLFLFFTLNFCFVIFLTFFLTVPNIFPPLLDVKKEEKFPACYMINVLDINFVCRFIGYFNDGFDFHQGGD